MMELIAGYVLGQRASTRAAAMGVVAGHMAKPVQDQVDDQRIDRMLLVIEALWSLLKERGLTDEQLANRIKQLDMQDGVADGKRTPSPVTCKKCGSKVAANLAHCQICGAETGATPGPLAGI